MQTRPNRRWGNSRALSTATGAVILAIIVIVGGVGSFVAFNTVSSKPSCEPSTSPACAVSSNPNDLKILAPLSSALTGASLPFTVLPPTGESFSSYTFHFGNGANVTTSSTSVDYVYTNPGTYFVSVTATLNGVTHTNYQALTKVTVATSYTSDPTGIFPTSVGEVISNTTSSSGATAVIHTGDTLTLNGAYTLAPTNPAYSLATPSFTNSAGITGTITTNPASATGTFTFPTPGFFTVTYVGSATSTTETPATAYQNYTWTIAVAPTTSNYALAGSAATTSTHPGQIISYETITGAHTFDPAIDYETAGYEVILNTYETLIMYNGSAAGPNPTDFVPQLATCVPGSGQCTALYGTDLIDGSNYTFVIDPNAQFYDPTTGAHWGVYPTDVYFSVLRTMGFAQYPSIATTAGWILSQALLPGGNSSWDGGEHGLFNNTPQNMLDSMSINDSAWCPAIALSEAHGCITFHANGTNAFGNAWPEFLEFIADAEGAGVESAGWVSGSGTNGGQNGIPYWTEGNVSGSGDHPVYLPGGTDLTTTNSTAFQTYVASIPDTGYDTWEQSYVNPATGAYSGNSQWNVVASGPYYLFNTQIHTSYELKANPYYVANPNCNYTGCEPAPGTYANQVTVYWETTPTPGETALASGAADFAEMPAGDTALLLQLTQEGKATSLVVPTISTIDVFFNLAVNETLKYMFTSTPINIPSDFFASEGLRQFFINAYPYAAIEQQVLTKDGIQYGFGYGGAIPQFMGNYYPSNIPWPLGNPNPDANIVGTAGWWWAQIRNASSPWYDPEVAACTPANPCEFPIYGQLSDPDGDQRLTLFINEVSSLTGGAIKMNLVDITFVEFLTWSETEPGGSPLTMTAETGWIPDYPDPTDYVVAFYYPDSTYTGYSALNETISLYNTTLPGGAACPTDANYYLNISTELPSSDGYVPQSCSGAAYHAMLDLLYEAGPLNAGPLRVMLYDQAEQIAFQLGLQINQYQSTEVFPMASWINPSSLNTNIMIAGGYVSIWYNIRGNGVVASPTT